MHEDILLPRINVPRAPEPSEERRMCIFEYGIPTRSGFGMEELARSYRQISYLRAQTTSSTTTHFVWECLCSLVVVVDVVRAVPLWLSPSFIVILILSNGIRMQHTHTQNARNCYWAGMKLCVLFVENWVRTSEASRTTCFIDKR